MAFTGLELTTDGDRDNLGISQEEGASDVSYLLYGTNESTPPTVAKLSEFIDFVNGGVSNLEPKVVSPGTAGAGKVVRVLPPVHPWRPELSAAAVVSLTGAGTQLVGNATQVFGLTPMVTQFPHWTQYQARVRFTKRPYFLLSDEKINLVSGSTYYKPDGTDVPYYYADEWRRFCTTTRAPTGDTVNATFGQMELRTQSGDPPNTNPYPGSVYVHLQNSVVEITWFQVPYRYCLDFTIAGTTYKSYLTRFTNCVNQRAWNGYAPGTLLYLGATPTAYIPSTPKRQKLLNALALGLDQSLLMNVKLKFLHTSREGTDVPDTGNPLLTNLNNVAGGHNLQPYFGDRRFYYAASVATTDADRRASFESFPFELFFTDPLLAQPSGVI